MIKLNDINAVTLLDYMDKLRVKVWLEGANYICDSVSVVNDTLVLHNIVLKHTFGIVQFTLS